MRRFFKNFAYTFFSNILVLIITAIITFIIPKLIGVEEYSYYQLYSFYVLYIGFLHFGWPDGIYLRYGGAYYDKLNRSRFSAQFLLFLFFEFIVAFILLVFGQVFIATEEKRIISICLAFAVMIELPKTFLKYILQCTNRMKEYAILNMVDKIVYMFAVIGAVLCLQHFDFVSLIVASLLSNGLALGYAVYQCRDLVFAKPENFHVAINEASENIKAGINLMLSTIAGMLLNGIVKISIEQKWSVTTFGKISLTMSVSNMLMVVIRAISLIMFPFLKRVESSKLESMYAIMRTCLMVPLLGMLVVYYPAKFVLASWLPGYADGLKYMALLFPVCIYESKMSMIIETYMKTLRLEKVLLRVNVISLFICILTTIIIVFGMGSLDLAVASITVITAFRCILAEFELGKIITINMRKDMLFEILLTVVFMVSSWFVGGIRGLFIYLLFYLIYLYIQKKEILSVFQMLCMLRK